MIATMTPTTAPRPEQTPEDKARELYREYRREYHFAGFNQRAFEQRVRRLARSLNGRSNWNAYMYLTYIATRAGWELTFKVEKEG